MSAACRDGSCAMRARLRRPANPLLRAARHVADRPMQRVVRTEQYETVTDASPVLDGAHSTSEQTLPDLGGEPRPASAWNEPNNEPGAGAMNPLLKAAGQAKNIVAPVQAETRATIQRLPDSVTGPRRAWLYVPYGVFGAFNPDSFRSYTNDPRVIGADLGIPCSQVRSTPDPQLASYVEATLRRVIGNSVVESLDRDSLRNWLTVQAEYIRRACPEYRLGLVEKTDAYQGGELAPRQNYQPLPTYAPKTNYTPLEQAYAPKSNVESLSETYSLKASGATDAASPGMPRWVWITGAAVGAGALLYASGMLDGLYGRKKRRANPSAIVANPSHRRRRAKKHGRKHARR